ncbi:GntR family transcriptional regulator [Paenibacillus sp. UNC451MF]|uniref:GntR family transcriptional regulator n=1 Tax=Paenibacillus sp. UNC451MF TaxID=1449063 RepID=UPI00048D2FA6|nr:GntR family transcriptional regulator [Paenibacillus sp. UNC451MF]
MSNTVVETSLLATQVYKALRQNIMGGKYAPGDKLDIHKLASEFGVSRSPVKDAFNQLVHDGLIEVLPRKGTYVTQSNPKDFVDILDARLMIETWAITQVINSISESHIADLLQITSEMDGLVNNQETDPFPFELYSKLDKRFHQTIVEWTGNQKVLAIYVSLNAHATLARVVYSTSFESTKKRHSDHNLLCDALEKRDLPTFTGVLQSHIESMKMEALSRWNQLDG